MEENYLGKRVLGRKWASGKLRQCKLPSLIYTVKVSKCTTIMSTEDYGRCVDCDTYMDLGHICVSCDKTLCMRCGTDRSAISCGVCALPTCGHGSCVNRCAKCTKPICALCAAGESVVDSKYNPGCLECQGCDNTFCSQCQTRKYSGLHCDICVKSETVCPLVCSIGDRCACGAMVLCSMHYDECAMCAKMGTERATRCRKCGGRNEVVLHDERFYTKCTECGKKRRHRYIDPPYVLGVRYEGDGVESEDEQVGERPVAADDD